MPFLATPRPKFQTDGLFQGLTDRGYTDGRNIVVDWFTAPTTADLPALAANVLRELAAENGEEGFAWPLATDEIEVIACAWEKAGFSIRKLQKIVAGTVAARNATAVRH